MPFSTPFDENEKSKKKKWIESQEGRTRILPKWFLPPGNLKLEMASLGFGLNFFYRLLRGHRYSQEIFSWLGNDLKGTQVPLNITHFHTKKYLSLRMEIHTLRLNDKSFRFRYLVILFHVYMKAKQITWQWLTSFPDFRITKLLFRYKNDN